MSATWQAFHALEPPQAEQNPWGDLVGIGRTTRTCRSGANLFEFWKS
jgi:hypothetical protein